MQVGHQLLQPGGESLRAHEDRGQGGQQQVHPGFPPVPGREVDHLAGRAVAAHVRGRQPERVDGRRVEEPFVTGSLPHHDRPPGADRVQRRAVQWAVPEPVVAPGEQPLVGIAQPALRGREPLPVVRRGGRRRVRPVRQDPVLDGDHLGHQGGRAEDRMQMLVDQPGAHHRVGEGVVHRSRVEQVLDRADRNDAVTGHSNGGRVGKLGVHGDHPAGRVHRDLLRDLLLGHGPDPAAPTGRPSATQPESSVSSSNSLGRCTRLTLGGPVPSDQTIRPASVTVVVHCPRVTVMWWGAQAK